MSLTLQRLDGPPRVSGESGVSETGSEFHREDFDLVEGVHMVDYSEALWLATGGEGAIETRHLRAMWDRICRLQYRLLELQYRLLERTRERDAATELAASFRTSCDERDVLISELLYPRRES